MEVAWPPADRVNGGGGEFGPAGWIDEGQKTRSAAVVGQWQAVGDMKIVYPAAYATGIPIGMPGSP